MACETFLKPNQKISERVDEVRRVVSRVDALLASGRIKPVIGPQGAIAFPGITATDRDGVTDACIYRRIMSTGSALARSAIARSELMSGRTVNKQAVGQGAHSHDGGGTWHNHKG